MINKALNESFLWLCATGQVFEKLSALNTANGSVWINYSRYGCLWTSHSPSGCNKACLFISVFLMFLRWSSENQSRVIRCTQWEMPSVCFSWRFMWRSPERPGGCCGLAGNLRRLSTRRRFHRLELCFPRDHRRASPEQMSPEASEHLLSYDFFKR